MLVTNQVRVVIVIQMLMIPFRPPIKLEKEMDAQNSLVRVFAQNAIYLCML